MPAYRRSRKGSAVLTFLPFVDRDSVQVGLGSEGQKAVDAEMLAAVSSAAMLFGPVQS